jgi:hypothetical protein
MINPILFEIQHRNRQVERDHHLRKQAHFHEANAARRHTHQPQWRQLQDGVYRSWQRVLSLPPLLLLSIRHGARLARRTVWATKNSSPAT